MRIAFFLLAALFLFSCKKQGAPESEALQAAIKAHQENPSTASADSIYQAYDALVAARGFTDPGTAALVAEVAGIAAAQNNPLQALGYYRDYLVQYPDQKDQADKLFDAIAVAEKLGAPELNDIFYKSFATRFPDDNRTSELTKKITQPDIQADSIVRFIGKNMFNDSTFRLNEARAHLYITACEAAIMANPTLPKGPDYLHRAAETARTLREIPKAISLYDWIIQKYPADPQASTSLFLKAFTYDNDLKQFEKAGYLYNEYLTKYPTGEFAESAKFLLDNLGKSEEELLKMLKKDTTEMVQ
jgi:tetratricopeptide (TPR) repeat protein